MVLWPRLGQVKFIATNENVTTFWAVINLVVEWLLVAKKQTCNEYIKYKLSINK